MKELTANAKGTFKVLDANGKETGQVVKFPIVAVKFQGAATLEEIKSLKYFPKGIEDALDDLNAYTVIQVQNAGRSGMTLAAKNGERDDAKLAAAAKTAMTAFINGERKPRQAGTSLISWSKAVEFWKSDAGKKAAGRTEAEAALKAANALPQSTDPLDTSKQDAIQAVVKGFFKANAPKPAPVAEAAATK